VRPIGRASLFNRLAASVIWRSGCLLRSVMHQYMHGGPAAFRFELAGDFNAADAWSLEQDWREVSSAIGNRLLVVDLGFTPNDEAARSLFRRWYARGIDNGTSVHKGIAA
jgi:hypothetical protein